jgi:hypothetical protein
VTHAYDLAQVRAARMQHRRAADQNAEAHALIRQIALHLGVRSKHPADLLAATEQLPLSMKAMCKDWEDLAEQIRNMQKELADVRRQLVDVTAERDQLRALINLSNASSDVIVARVSSRIKVTP